MFENDEEVHESYGMVGLSRCSVGPAGMNLFGSSIRHGSVMTLTVRKASKRRELHREWIHGREEIVEVFLSPAQFADLITSPNVGFGVPCSIRHMAGKAMGECPEVQQRQLFEQEFKDDVRKVMSDAGQLVKDVKELLDGKANITQADRKAIVHKLDMLMQHINSSMPFVQSQFNEAMDKTVTEAKAEVEEFVNAKIHSLGIQALTSEIAQALAAPANSAPFQLPEHVDAELEAE